jgi:phenylacetate-CoA ligase
MTGGFLSAYHRLPAPARAVVASAHGLRMRRWRYSADTERLAAEAAEREKWEPARWQAYQDERLAIILERAAARVPFYRDQWSQRRRRGGTSRTGRFSRKSPCDGIRARS